MLSELLLILVNILTLHSFNFEPVVAQEAVRHNGVLGIIPALFIRCEKLLSAKVVSISS